MAEREIHKALRSLAHDLRAGEQLESGTPHRWKTVPQHLHGLLPEDTVPASNPVLAMSRSTDRLYRKTLDLLLADRRSRYLSDDASDRELEEHLWSFCCEMALDESLRTPTAQKNKVIDFIESIDIPCADYEAVVQITGITIPPPLRMGEVEFVRGSPTLLKEWGIWSGPVRPQWRGHTVARMEVRAGTLRAAQYRALERASMLCDEFRIALPSSVRTHVDDSDLEFGTGWTVVRGGGEWVHQPGRLAGQPTRWHPKFLRAALDFLDPLYTLRASGRSDIREKVELAIRWFGMSRTVGTPWAMKQIAICSGLEAILVKGESEPLKGAILAIRAALLSIAIDGRFRDPGEALALYRDRSELVHGARTTADPRAVRRTLEIASGTLRDYMAIANQELEIQNHKRLLDFIGNDKTLTDLGRWVEEHDPWGKRDLLKGIKQLMK